MARRTSYLAETINYNDPVFFTSTTTFAKISCSLLNNSIVWLPGETADTDGQPERAER